MKAVGEVAKVNCRRCILPCNRDRSALVCWHGNKRKGIRPCQRTNNLSYPGKPVIAGTRITVEIILEKLAAGETPEQILGLKQKLSPNVAQTDFISGEYVTIMG